MSEITLNQLENLENAYLKNDKLNVLQNALFSNDLTKIASNQQAKAAQPFIFSIDLKTHGITNQFQSGRCWIFSAMNVLREALIKELKIEGDFELSQNYIAFYDKLEKANWFMECVKKELATDLDAEKMRFLLEGAVSDGGQWNMLVSLVEKYGVCPKDAYPESFQAGHTHKLNSLMNRRLRKFALEAKSAFDAGNQAAIDKLQQETLKEVYQLLATNFGLPPKEFVFEYYDEDHKAHAKELTPHELYKLTNLNLSDYVNVINGPTEDKPFYQTFTVEHLGNVVDGQPVQLLNLPLDEFKEATIKQMQAGELVWFGCDCSQDADREGGMWNDEYFQYEKAFDLDLALTKEEMLNVKESAMNHAMVLTGVNLVDGEPNRWKIENSWGDKVGHKGYYVASDTWFDKYVYVVAINKKYLSEKALKALEGQPTLLKPWDPFGTLAD